VVELITGLRAEVVRANLERVQAEIAGAVERAQPRRAPVDRGNVEILAASKYVGVEELPVLAQAGVRLLGENRAADLQEKVATHGELFEWDFIGQLQSRRVRWIVPYVRLIHSVASESALRELERHLEIARPGLRILLEVNVAGEQGKAGIAPEEIAAFIERSPVAVAGLMTMPPLSQDRCAARAGRQASPGAPVDGHLPGLSRGGRRGRNYRADRHEALPLALASGRPQGRAGLNH